jgi:phosphoenolpyruvate synthase/pyruvate phosphate dikinase
VRPQVLERQLGLWPEHRFWPGQSGSYFLVQRPDGDILEEWIGAKEVWSVFHPKRGRVVEQPTPAEQTRRSCLSHAEVHELVRLAVEIEMREGCP